MIRYTTYCTLYVPANPRYSTDISVALKIFRTHRQRKWMWPSYGSTTLTAQETINAQPGRTNQHSCQGSQCSQILSDFCSWYSQQTCMFQPTAVLVRCHFMPLHEFKGRQWESGTAHLASNQTVYDQDPDCTLRTHSWLQKHFCMVCGRQCSVKGDGSAAINLEPQQIAST